MRQIDCKIEHELRYLRPDGFLAPRQLAGLRHVSHDRAVHHDTYYDSQGPALRAKRASLRLRRHGPRLVTATFKQRVDDMPDRPGPATARYETESQIAGPSADPELIDAAVNVLHNRALEAAREAIADPDAKLMPLFSITNDRTNHHYTDDDGGHVILSEDNITYPDGSRERRIEVELIDGSRKLLSKAGKQLASSWPLLQAVKRGKQGEGRRRLAALLSV